ncbi:uncharacterized protein LOC131204101 isoform X2 [Ahaetulla prasina]|uniref:uncharacterized protein LOC131204101 isoform X2 n=1 Tax=Ahaetulla prasina TaxID=499056 RepID=UPI002648C207|nr:uncharacterized protein LOC131204101 isoform X2 [Ahaetulla prasina]XP_058050967.1 uncharacterized protein LOC131204101 isoform X2 [Ahaetulla prasina]
MMIAALFIIGGAVTVFTIFRRRQKANRSDTENDLIDLPSAQKPASLPLNQNEEVKSQLTAENIQVVHLDNMKEQEEEVQKTSSQPPYYDMAATEPTPNTDKLTAGNNKDSNVQYAELDTSVLTTSSPSHRTSVPAGGDLVEYATIQANVC